MAWLAISLEAEAGEAEALADALIEAGAISVSCDDADAGTSNESAQFAEPGQAPPGAWRRNLLTALVAEDAQPGELVATAARAVGKTTPDFRVRRVDDQDWVRNTQLQFEPIQVTPAIWIVPSWCEPPDAGAINISIDPGLAFGTGSHPTTRLVIRWLEQALDPGHTVVDYGCGSGILAIVAARLGAREVIGVDIDPQAIVAANDNALKNSVEIRFGLPDEFPILPSDIAVANILANPLIVLAPVIASCSRNQIALSGVLEDQAEDVIAAYRSEFSLEVSDSEDGWVLITGARR